MEDCPALIFIGFAEAVKPQVLIVTVTVLLQGGLSDVLFNLHNAV